MIQITLTTMQHDLFVNPGRQDRAGFPLVVTLQANVVESGADVVAPLTLLTRDAPKIRLMPIVEHDGKRYLVVFTLMTSLPGHLLRRPVGSIAAWRDDLTRALHWLFLGI